MGEEWWRKQSQSRTEDLDRRERRLAAREQALRPGEGEAAPSPETQRLTDVLREANQQLVIAAVNAQDLVDELAAKRAELERDEERLRALLLQPGTLVWIVDPGGHVVDEAGLTSTRPLIPAGEPAEAWAREVHPDDRERVERTWRSAMERRAEFSCELRLRADDGTWTWMAARALPLPSKGPVREWVGTMTDVTERRRADDERSLAVSVLGHDLRNPLSAIIVGLSLLMRRSAVDDSDAKVLRRIARSAERMKGMVRDMLDFARTRQGAMLPLQLERADLGEVAERVVAEHGLVYPSAPVALHIDGDVRGQWDSDRLAQLLSNLLANALTHGSGGVYVDIHGGAADDVEIVVGNRGPTIPPALLARIFEPFHRSGPRSTGLGLGLYIVKSIAEAHGGTVTLASTAGETRFSVRLPRAPQRATPAPAPAMTPASSS